MRILERMVADVFIHTCVGKKSIVSDTARGREKEERERERERERYRERERNEGDKEGAKSEV